MSSFEDATDAAGLLADDARRTMYLFIRAQGRPVGRDEAAAVAGMSRKLAAFHLDKLVEKGLLSAHYSRLTGRSGPGAGRPSKLYEPSDAELVLSIPPRAYEIVGDILVDAIDAAFAGESPRDAARRVAQVKGTHIGRLIRRERRFRPLGAKRALSVAEGVLQDIGYEAYRDELGGIRLRNCPFHRLARKSPELVCGINQAFIDGLLRGLGNNSVDALLELRANECCVHLHAR